MGEGSRPRERALLILVLCVAGLLRFGYLAEFRGAPDFEHPFIDAGFHDQWARSLAFDDWVRPARLPDPQLETTPYLRPPGYPVFLSWVYRLLGPGYLAPRVVQAVLGLLAVFLLHRLGRRVGGPAVGLLAGALYGCAWVPIYFEAEFHAASLLVVLLLAHWEAMASWAQRPTVPRALLAGVWLGLAATVRPNALALVPVSLLWGSLFGAARGGGARWKAAAAIAFGCVLAIAPVTLRNWRASGEFVPITTGLGVNLFIGNHPGATGRIEGQLPGIGRFDTCYDYPAVVASVEAKVGRPMSHREVSSWFVDRAWEFVRSDPAKSLALTAHKLALALGPEEVSHNKVLVLERRNSGVLSRLPGPFPLYLAAALVGLMARFGRRGSDASSPRHASSARDRSPTAVAWLIALSALALLASLVPFFAASRYRVPLWPPAALFAAFGMVSLVHWIRASRWAAAAAAVAILVAGGILSARGGGGPPDLAKWHCDRGRSLRRAGDFEAADAEYRRALAVPPPRATVYYEYALLAADRGDGAAAVEAYRRAIELDPGHLLAHMNLGTHFARTGERAPARALLERAIEIDGRYAPAYVNLATLAFQEGRVQEALDLLTRLEAFEPGRPDALALAARCHERVGESARAVAAYEALVAREPNVSTWRQKLAWILATSPKAGVRDGARAIELVKDLAVPGAGPDLYGTLAAALAETGEFPAAVNAAERALRLAEERGEGRRVGVLRSVLEACRAGRPVRPGPSGSPGTQGSKIPKND